MSGLASNPATITPLSVDDAAPGRTGFCRLARVYAWLEKMMFGRRLERARFHHLHQLRECRSILLLGEGDGRCLARLVGLAPQARLHCVDSSPGMLARAAARLNAAERARVTFIHADVLAWNPPAAAYDAVVTVFFLDCLSAAEVRQLVRQLQPALRPGARWLWADFVLPKKGLARWRARLGLGLMYGFFRHSAGLAAHTLPPSEEILRAAGWQPGTRHYFSAIFAASVVFSQPGCVS
jgi:SAM-dependent methyltransferase